MEVFKPRKGDVAHRIPERTAADFARADMICLSHLRWDFVYQRPQHLLSRCARSRRVFFVEEPIYGDGPTRLEMCPRQDMLWVVIPHLPHGTPPAEANELQRKLLDGLIGEQGIRDYLLWYYTPMAMPFSRHLLPAAVIYDCMDELSHFKGAPPQMREREAELFHWADVVFAGGQSLFEAKCHQHRNVHAFPSSVDVEHFAIARRALPDPADQADVPFPRIGFFGVVDERFDLPLLEACAERRPDWQFVVIGPVVKIDPVSLPKRPNIHYLGGKAYAELPRYLAGWDAAMLPFARNDSTRFISPTKTPEYLAAGRPVVSTPIRDVVNPYGNLGLVRIGESPDEFLDAIELALEDGQDSRWREKVDSFLSRLSWDVTWAAMEDRMREVFVPRRFRPSSLLVN